MLTRLWRLVVIGVVLAVVSRYVDTRTGGSRRTGCDTATQLARPNRPTPGRHHVAAPG